MTERLFYKVQLPIGAPHTTFPTCLLLLCSLKRSCSNSTTCKVFVSVQQNDSNSYKFPGWLCTAQQRRLGVPTGFSSLPPNVVNAL